MERTFHAEDEDSPSVPKDGARASPDRSSSPDVLQTDQHGAFKKARPSKSTDTKGDLSDKTRLLSLEDGQDLTDPTTNPAEEIHDVGRDRLLLDIEVKAVAPAKDETLDSAGSSNALAKKKKIVGGSKHRPDE